MSNYESEKGVVLLDNVSDKGIFSKSSNPTEPLDSADLLFRAEVNGSQKSHIEETKNQRNVQL